MEYWDHTMGPQERVALRASAVQAVNNGEKKRHVALRFGITRQTLHNWVAKHQHGGTEALAARPRGRVRRQVLEPWQEAQVAGAIMLLSPSTVRQCYTRWTKKAITEYVEQSFGVSFNAWQVESHLRRWGFDSHKDVSRALLHNPASQNSPNGSIRMPIEAAASL